MSPYRIIIHPFDVPNAFRVSRVARGHAALGAHASCVQQHVCYLHNELWSRGATSALFEGDDACEISREGRNRHAEVSVATRTGRPGEEGAGENGKARP
jgi:hypothetical protein